MKIILHKNFGKQYGRLAAAQKKRFKSRRDVFLADPQHPILNNHPLQGAYRGYRSINIAGDLRAVYRMVEHDVAYFVAIGTHSKLYSK